MSRRHLAALYEDGRITDDACRGSKVSRATVMLVALYLADRANDRTGRAWPAVPTIERHLGVERRNVQRALGVLEHLRVVVALEGRSRGGPGRSTTWVVLPELDDQEGDDDPDADPNGGPQPAVNPGLETTVPDPNGGPQPAPNGGPWGTNGGLWGTQQRSVAQGNIIEGHEHQGGNTSAPADPVIPVLDPTTPPEDQEEIREAFRAFADRHGQARLKAGLQHLHRDGRRFRFASQARKAIEAWHQATPFVDEHHERELLRSAELLADFEARRVAVAAEWAEAGPIDTSAARAALRNRRNPNPMDDPNPGAPHG